MTKWETNGKKMEDSEHQVSLLKKSQSFSTAKLVAENHLFHISYE